MSTFQPLYDRLLVRRCEAAKYHGMIEIPDAAKEKPMEGEVLAVGAGRYNDSGNLMPMGVRAGDRILMGKYAGTEIKIDGSDLLILREDEVLGIIVGVPDATFPGEGSTVETDLPTGTITVNAEPIPTLTAELFPEPESPAPGESAEDFLSALKEIAKP